MRKFLLIVVALGGALAIGSAAYAQGMMGGYYGGGYGGYGPGAMMGYGGYGHSYGMMQGYGSGYGPGMTYGDGDRSYRRGPRYRGERLCWHRADERGDGYYAACPN